jgi:L-lactate dehydrogenase complex protein LldE
VETSASVPKKSIEEMRIGLFIPCYIDMVYPEVGIATLELLERFGLNVDYPLDQTCCGQPMSNRGDEANAPRRSDYSSRTSRATITLWGLLEAA